MCASVKTTKVQMGQETLYPIPIPCKLLSQIVNDLLGLLKVIHSCKYIVKAVDYTSKFLGRAFKEKTREAVAEFLYKLLWQYGYCDIHMIDQGTELMNSISKAFTILQVFTII